jgi:GT2 family glycosyltransferase
VSTGDDLVLLNNDTIVPRGWLSRLVRHLRHDEVGLVGPVSNFVGNEARIEVDYQTWEEMESFAKQRTRKYDGQGADIQMLAMFCVAMRRDVYAQIGPLDEQFGLGMFEDDDYAHRVRVKGYRVICAADVFVHHFGQASFKRLIETGEYNPLFQRNLKTFESKWQVKWTPRSGVPLDFRADYAGGTTSSQNGRKSASNTSR